MSEISQAIWSQICEIIKTGINEQGYETWITPVRFLSASETEIALGVPSTFFQNWIADHYTEIIEKAVQTVCGKAIPVTYQIVQTEERHIPEDGGGEEVPSSKGPGPASPESKPAADIHEKVPHARQVFPFLFKKPAPAADSKLNPRLSFDNFVIGPSNRFAHAASLAVAESPARAYNPLFIYGKVGLGKTHLMQSIGSHILQKRPQLQFCYLSSEKFTNQLIGAIQNRSTPKFRQMYRNVDLLLIDDIHFIAGKEATQEEFFHTFNTLYDAHKQIVVSSDRPPKEIAGLEERLISRFEWGLVTDIQPPDLETRIAILRKKGEREGLHVPDDVTFLIADKIHSNIRELEGALIRVAAYSKLVGREISHDMVREVLKDMFMEEEKKVTIDLIQIKVAEYFDMRTSDMRAKKRTRSITHPRQIAMYLSRELTDHSLPEIGHQFGGRDHTTVLHAYDKVEREIKGNRDFELSIQKIMKLIKS